MKGKKSFIKMRKSIRSGIVFAIITVFTLITVFAATVFADESDPEGFLSWEEFTGGEEASPANDPEPLVFDETTPSATGSGWTWENDNQEKVLTLDGFKMTLKDYTDPYEAGIKLPGGSTIVVKSDSGLEVIGKPKAENNPVAILADGDLTMKGSGTLLIHADQGADGIKATGNLRIGEGKDPKKGFPIQIEATGYTIYAGSTLSIRGSNLTLGTIDVYQVSTDENKGGMIVDGADVQPEDCAVDIRDSAFRIVHLSTDACGIYAGSGSVHMLNTNFTQTVDKEKAKNAIGIKACNGNVDVEHSNVSMQLWTFTGTKGETALIEAGSDGGNITISDSQVKGKGDGVGLSAQNDVVINNSSNIDITAGDHTLVTEAGLSIDGSKIQLITTGAYKNAINAVGAVTINASDIYLSGKGERSSGMFTNAAVNISGDSYADMEGTLSAIQMIAESETDPITLDGVGVREGGSLQHVSSDDKWTYFYSEKTEEATLEDSSKEVIFATNSRLIFLEQPEDQVVKYPDGASFSVRMSREDKVASYQWYARDFVGNVFALNGTSASTSVLVIPSTEQRDNQLTYYCVVTDTAGNKLVSKEAYLDKSNKTEDKSVLYIGNHAIEPGETLSLGKMDDLHMGTGSITFDENGTDITFNNVYMDNSTAAYDVRLSPAMCIRLDKNGTDGETFTIKLKGENKIVNYFEDPGGNGISLDFMLRGDEAQGQPPTVIIDGESLGGTLMVKGGAAAIRSISNLVINADVTVLPLKAGDSSYLDAIVCDDLSEQAQHDLTIGDNHKIDLTTYGSGLSSLGAITIGENAEVDIDMTMPFIYSSGSSEVKKSAVVVGADQLTLKPNSKLSINGLTDPYIMNQVTECSGIRLDRGSKMVADNSTIDITMTALPYEDPLYIMDFAGISGSSDVTLTNSSISVAIDGDKWAYSAHAISSSVLESAPEATTNVALNSSTADLSATGYFNAFGIVSDTNVSVDSSDLEIDTTSYMAAYGLAPNEDLNVKASQIDVVTKCVGDAGTSYGVLGSNMNLDLSDANAYIKSDATNENGLAFVANTGDAGNDPKSYDPSYKAKMINGTFAMVQPKNGTVNLASIPGTIHPYMYVESIYDTADTSKPASKVELTGIRPAPIDKAEVTLSYVKTTYNGKAKKPGVSVKLDGKTLKYGVDYTVAYANNINAGKATVTVKGIGAYSGSAKAYFKINKAKNKAKKLSPAVKKLSAKKLAKAKAVYKLKATLTAKTKAVLKVAKYAGKAKKYIVVSQNGKVTVKKGTPAGTYKIKVLVITAPTKNYVKTATPKTIAVVVK